MDNELTLLIGKGEKILYAGKPDKRCFIFECIFNPLLPFAIVWGLIDMFFIGAAFSSDKADEAALRRKSSASRNSRRTSRRPTRSSARRSATSSS